MFERVAWGAGRVRGRQERLRGHTAHVHADPASRTSITSRRPQSMRLGAVADAVGLVANPHSRDSLVGQQVDYGDGVVASTLMNAGSITETVLPVASSVPCLAESRRVPSVVRYSWTGGDGTDTDPVTLCSMR